MGQGHCGVIHEPIHAGKVHRTTGEIQILERQEGTSPQEEAAGREDAWSSSSSPGSSSSMWTLWGSEEEHLVLLACIMGSWEWS